MKTQPRSKPSTPRFICDCGLAVRQVVLPDGTLIWVDEKPVLGGPLIVNTDRVVGQQRGSREDGFRRHHFTLRCHLVVA